MSETDDQVWRDISPRCSVRIREDGARLYRERVIVQGEPMTDKERSENSSPPETKAEPLSEPCSACGHANDHKRDVPGPTTWCRDIDSRCWCPRQAYLE